MTGRRRWLICSCTVLKLVRLYIWLTLLLLVSTGPIRAVQKLTLEEAIDLAMEHSFEIMASRHDSAAAMDNYRVSRAYRMPTLTIGAVSYWYDDVPSIDFPLIGSRNLGATENYQADLRLSLPLYTGGRISNRIKTGRENAVVGSLGVERQRLATAYDCRRAYLGLMLAGATERAAGASLKRVETIRTNVRNMYNSGVADSVDLLDTELAYQNAIQALAEKTSGRQNALRSLIRLIGIVVDPADSLPSPLPPDTTIMITADRITRTELKMYDHHIRAAEYLAQTNKSEYFPTLSGYVGYSYGKPYRDMFSNEWNGSFIAGLSVNWELNLGDKTGRNVSAANQAVFSARMARNELEESLMAMADISAENLRLAYSTYLRSRTEYFIVRDKFRLAQKSREAGEMSVNRLLEIENELTTAEELYQAVITNYYLAETEYFYVLGSDKIYGGL